LNIGLFTDSYFPQVSGVATSIKTLATNLEKRGNSVYIFTTTDPHVAKDAVEPNVFRFSSIPFVSFTDRRIAVGGFIKGVEVAKDLKLDIVHTQTEFSLGLLGKYVAKLLNVPAVHTYHTMYENYLHYVLNGKLLRPYHVKQYMRAFLANMNGVICPSDKTLASLTSYGIKIPMRVIPTGVDLAQYEHQPTTDVRSEWHLAADTPILLSLSRVAYEKKIDVVLSAFPQILAQVPKAVLMIVGDGPALEDLQDQAKALGIADHVLFTGQVPHHRVQDYYHAANVLISASDTESQGLTYIEALAADLKVVVVAGEYTEHLLDDPSLGITFTSTAGMVKAAVEYLQHPHAFDDETIRQRKLYDISADHFGEQVLSFYRTAEVHYASMVYDEDKDGEFFE
jgi:1,2-diacylglycerol 3-alpha-glucosyltransferase